MTIKLFIYIVIFISALTIFALWADSKYPNPNAGMTYADVDCKNAYGKDFSYVDGRKSPSLCVSDITGEIRYFDLIN